ncbi:hypothetical protein G9P44_001610 [Scheffersomyces stipitis]|nr:hypothetical protein G9P44_001610 [Scheffersomyces stipitis]
MSTSSYDRVSLDSSLPTEDSTSSSPPFPQVSHFNKSEKYTIVFEDELLHIDSSNWRTSTLLKVQIFSAYCVFILFGLAEQTIGSIIPILQKDYSINDLQVSLIFISSITGYFTMALINDYTHKALGIKGVVVLGSTSMTLGYLIISTRPPFFIFALCYVMSGIGFGSLDAGLNGWMGNLIDSNQLLGILHGCYGIGCMISPPLITYLLEKHTNPWMWNHYYIVLSVVGCCCVVSLILTFKNETPKKYKFMGQLKNEAHKKKSKAPINDEEIELDSLTKTQDVDISDEELTASDSEQEDNTASLLVALKSPLVWAFATILFIYVGGEVAFGAWLMTFLIRIKKFPYKLSSWMATSFWMGLTVGRIALGFVTAYYFKTELMANFVYIILSTLGYFVFWLFAATNWVVLLFLVVFLTGMAVGPIFPTTIITAITILPSKYHASGIGFVCAFGGGGAAGVPFLIGLVAQSSEVGLRIFPLIVFVIFLILVAMWAVIVRRFTKTYDRNAI